jgi:hypothetical protein
MSKKMRNLFFVFLTGMAIIVTGSFAYCQTDMLEKDFISPPENIRTGVYWYWINGHVTKEGVINDLKSMKKAGINWVLIGSDITSGNDLGAVTVFSPEWYEAIHTALKTATELNIDIGLFNCRGTSEITGVLHGWDKDSDSNEIESE